jgi:predicted lipoprotein with Yx(FWY)xxD motif
MTRVLRAASALVLLALALAACGTSSSSSSSQPTSPSPSAPSPSPSLAPSPALVQTAAVTVAGVSKTVLTDSQGLTIYYRSMDGATKVTCTGTCAASWPPVLLATGTPTGSTSVTGTLSVFAGPNGSQVLYNGHPLYRWVKDTAPGQATGQGIGGFLVATPDLAASG